MRQKIEVNVHSEKKLIIYYDGNVEKAIKLAGFFRNSGITAVVSDKSYNEAAYDEIIAVDEKVLERYGIK